jgi:uncharacterized protein
MFVGLLQFELIVPGATSLKDKRRVVKSIKDRLHREHLVSIAEVEAQEHHRLAVMGVALVSNSAPYIDRVFDRVIAKLRAIPDARLGESTRQIIRGDQPPLGSELDTEPLWTPDERRGGAEEEGA